MFKILDPEDSSFLDNSNFMKNAILYKDMLCFYEAYRQIMEHSEELPNFCYVKDKVCLEGICLLIKMYATEFKFETIKLTLDYLKILYYAVASYAEGETVDREVIVKEFDDYRLASFDYCNKQKDGLESKQKEVIKERKDIKHIMQKSQRSKKSGKACHVSAIAMLVVSILSICLPILVLNYKQDNKTLFVSSIVCVSVCFLVTITLFILGKKLTNISSDLLFQAQNKKKTNEVNEQEFAQIQAKYYKIFCEKYEYKTCFPEVFSRYTKVLSIKEIIEKANKYKMLSYNMIYDIGRLFKSQQRDINDIISEIDSIALNGDYKKEFNLIYSKICDQDWLYYNAEIRLHYLKKFTDLGEREYEWKVDRNGKKVSPFDVNIRELSREMVAFSSEKGKKMIPAPFAEIVQTKFFKNMEQLNFINGYTIEEFKKVKASYLTHFYGFESLKSLSNVFFDKKDNLVIKNTEFPIDELEKVPTLVSLKLKLIENLTGLGNSDAGVIKSMAQYLFREENEDLIEVSTMTEDDIDYPKFTANKIEEHEDHFVYEVNGKKKIGYKIN